ncbi:hypothetical protein TTHERM_00548380 (macronuclear) [Tetrahymena thermophila SB210]|uniref:GCC2 and GCC3 family protein n=1 Tax=Tetrahymena thermophila (strain SB210) TaxID=312017 RepID=I7M0A9_TETTS|nr:hypothetical protein TTHERM_00548380 [Tetrahymena thermophila SB210]EAR86091.2 hypothetical protein TTHERM_00548380 [Tetrahymena thermophila SB210]|eukprot:XP_976686.2 hypothetical protein TTHERM_00548380 [Tetrahymena thermophila SB210]
MNSIVFCLILAFSLVKVAYNKDCKRCTFSKDGTDNDGPCTRCAKGTCTLDVATLGTDQSVCIARACQAGKRSNTGYDRDGRGDGCEDCKIGTYALEGSIICNLAPCGYGYYSKAGYYNIYDDGYCIACPIGKSTQQETTIGKDDSVCNLQLDKCPEGYWSTTGYNGNAKDSECKKCRYDTYSLAGSKRCNLISCSKGFYSPTGYNDLTQDDGCQECPIGKSTSYENTIGNDDSACDLQLKMCPEGKFSYTGYDLDGKGNGCFFCDPGTYSFEGSKICNLKPCGYGFYSSTGYYILSQEDDCQKCPIDKSTTYENTKGNDDSVCDLQLKMCPEGKFSYTGYDFDGKGNGCFICYPGTYSFEGSQICDLIYCGYGFYSTRGYYISSQEDECQKCPKGKFTTYDNTKGNDDSVCDIQLKLCPEGYFSQSGYYSDHQNYMFHCQYCDAGTHSLEGSTDCNLRPCGYGFYSKTGYYDINTEVQCQACPENTYTDGAITKGLDDSVCQSMMSEPTDIYSNDINTNSIIIKMTLSIIFLVFLF